MFIIWVTEVELKNERKITSPFGQVITVGELLGWWVGGLVGWWVGGLVCISRIGILLVYNANKIRQ